MILSTSDPICTARDPASLVTEWSELARRRARPSVFLTPEWIEVARAHDPRLQITLAIGGLGPPSPDILGIAALAQEPDGTLTFAGGEFTDEQDLVAGVDDGAAAEALGRWIAAERVPRVRLEYVPEDAPTADGVSRALRADGYEVRIERLVTAPRLEIPSDFETYVRRLGRKERHELRRKIRRLESGRRVSFRFAAEHERPAAVDRFVDLHRRSRGVKAAFMTDGIERFFRDVADATAARGWLRLGVLDVGGEDVAILFAFAYEGILALYNAAYDPAFAPLSVGIVSHAYAIRAAIAEGCATYDLLRGDERYKYDLGGSDRWLLRIEASRT